MRRCARSTNTQNAVTPTMMASSRMANGPAISPVLTCSIVRPTAPGSPATMPTRMIIEMPLPMPRSVICSPSHIRNIVPVVMVTVAVNSHDEPRGQHHAAVLQRHRGGERLERAKHHRAVARELGDLATAGLAFLAVFHQRRHDHRHHLDDDRRRDVGHHAHGEDRQALQRAAGEHVDHAQDGAGLVVEELRPRAAGSMPGTGMNVPMR